jgi:hypothetical protein
MTQCCLVLAVFLIHNPSGNFPAYERAKYSRSRLRRNFSDGAGCGFQTPQILMEFSGAIVPVGHWGTLKQLRGYSATFILSADEFRCKALKH